MSEEPEEGEIVALHKKLKESNEENIVSVVIDLCTCNCQLQRTGAGYAL